MNANKEPAFEARFDTDKALRELISKTTPEAAQDHEAEWIMQGWETSRPKIGIL